MIQCGRPARWRPARPRAARKSRTPPGRRRPLRAVANGCRRPAGRAQARASGGAVGTRRTTRAQLPRRPQGGAPFSRDFYVCIMHFPRKPSTRTSLCPCSWREEERLYLQLETFLELTTYCSECAPAHAPCSAIYALHLSHTSSPYMAHERASFRDSPPLEGRPSNPRALASNKTRPESKMACLVSRDSELAYLL